jgi:hypothetical protein
VLWYGMTKIVKGMEHSVKQLSSWLPWAKNDEEMEWFSSPPADISSTLTSTMFPEFNDFECSLHETPKAKHADEELKVVCGAVTCFTGKYTENKKVFWYDFGQVRVPSIEISTVMSARVKFRF